MSLAATAFNATLAASASYTVGAGKTAIFSARLATAAEGTTTMLINGNVAAVLFLADGGQIAVEQKPFACNAGDVISNSSGSQCAISLSGFLY